MVLAGRAEAQRNGLKIYISADMEGVVGVVTGEQLGPSGFEYGRFREFMTREVLAAIDAAKAAGAILAVPVTDTVKEAEEGTVVGSLDRQRLWAAQTPQVVRREGWLTAAALSDEDTSDDAAMLARLGLEVRIVESDPANIKITRPIDLVLARELLRERGL